MLQPGDEDSMAIWRLQLAENGMSRELVYKNSISGATQNLGTIHADVDASVLGDGKGAIGDFIFVPGERPLQLLMVLA